MPLHALHPLTADTITASVAGSAVVISPRYGESYSFDRAGRLLGFFHEGQSYQRTLDHRLLLRSLTGSRRIEVTPSDTAALLDQIFAAMRALAEILHQLDLAPEDRYHLADALARILAFGPDRLAADGARYLALYKPVSILPPDQYLALVLQATEGCSWNRCTFCGLYRDRDFRIHTLESFRAHCESVREFYAEGISLRRGIFLADANALIIPQARLRGMFEIVQEIFPQADGTPRPVYSFVSAFDVRRKSPDEWADLHTLGLDRAYIGLETGDNDLLRFLNKPGSVDDAIQAVRDLRAGGVSVGVIVMAGIGGDKFAASHVERTVEAIHAMKLGPSDLVYLSNYVSAPNTDYDYQTTVARIRALTDQEIQAQIRKIQTSVRVVVSETKVVPYHIEGFAL